VVDRRELRSSFALELIIKPGSNPTIMSYIHRYNASVVNIYNATSSLVHLKIILYSSMENSLAYYNADFVAVCKFRRRRHIHRIGHSTISNPGTNPTNDF
jgi:hypothetical protein